MDKLLNRTASESVVKYLSIFPAVAILGSRQCGKSTLVQMLSSQLHNFLYVDLQERISMQMLSEPELFFSNNRDKTICLDEVQLLPELFSFLRSEIDRDRKPGRFILLGSASEKLLQHTSETLAGRIGLIDLTPFTVSEVRPYDGYSIEKYWFRGGYPNSYLAADDEASCLWRENFIRTYIQRDIPQLEFNVAAPKMMRLLTMLAGEHGGMLNYAKLASAMDLSAPTIRHYIDILEHTYIARVLPPYYKNIKKRLVKTPRFYIRDSGLLHQILNISNYNHLLANSILGLSWEGLVIENVCSVANDAVASFYRSATGVEEMDLVLEYPDKLIGIECKASASPQVTEGFWKAIDTLQPTYTYIVAPITNGYKLRDNVEVIGLPELQKIL